MRASARGDGQTIDTSEYLRGAPSSVGLSIYSRMRVATSLYCVMRSGADSISMSARIRAGGFASYRSNDSACFSIVRNTRAFSFVESAKPIAYTCDLAISSLFGISAISSASLSDASP